MVTCLAEMNGLRARARVCVYRWLERAFSGLTECYKWKLSLEYSEKLQ